MKFIETNVKGNFIIEPDRFDDERGFFCKIWDHKEFAKQGLSTEFAQFNLAYNHNAGTLRGMHYQTAPHQEVKLVRCTRGKVFDVIIDLREDSPSYMQWAGAELTEDNHRSFYLPKGCAHGYITLTDKAEVCYNVSELYAPNAAAGLRWNDPAFNVKWPLQPILINHRDATYPDYKALVEAK